jgi:hypothetical protein
VPLTIVLGTSRCGSTMLSKMLAKHPDVMSISEFWRCFLETGDSIPTHAMSGEEFWQRVNDPAPFFDGLVVAGVGDVPIQPFPSRFNYRTGMPPFCRILSMSIGEPPDPLWDSLGEAASARPVQPVAEHCRALFADLAARRGRTVIVERTGGSLDYVGLLLEQFPEARFVFLHRDGADTVLSMSRHPLVRFSAIKELADSLFSESPSATELVPEELRGLTPEDFEGVVAPPFDKSRFQAFHVPLTYFAGMWSAMTRTGTREVRRVPPDRRTTLRYESILTNPRKEMTGLAEFMGIPADSAWLDWADGFADTGRIGSALRDMHPMDVAALRAACVTGNRAFDLLEAEHADRSANGNR